MIELKSLRARISPTTIISQVKSSFSKVGFLRTSCAPKDRFSRNFLKVTMGSYYRSDGVRITHNPYAPGLAEKYGSEGQTDSDGFDPYADTVGAGIYGGKVKRDPSTGEVLIGEQYQNHNSRPGPIYTGEGYTEMSQALRQGKKAVNKLLERDPTLVNEISTGGATPLHMCGMSQRNQLVTEHIIAKGGDINAVDTYGYTPLHRMASNNLAIGAEALLKAGADPFVRNPFHKETPYDTAMQAQAQDVIKVLMKYGDFKF